MPKMMIIDRPVDLPKGLLFLPDDRQKQGIGCNNDEHRHGEAALFRSMPASQDGREVVHRRKSMLNASGGWQIRWSMMDSLACNASFDYEMLRSWTRERVFPARHGSFCSRRYAKDTEDKQETSVKPHEQNLQQSQ